MKTTIIIILTALAFMTHGQNPDPTSLWIFRMEQNAQESALYKKFQGNDSGFPNSTGLFQKNDTIRYQTGQIFRTCEVSNHQLQGNYKVYFSNGQIYMSSFYKNNLPTDSTSIYDDSGKLVSVIRHLSRASEQQLHFDQNGKVKRIEDIQITPVSATTFKTGYVHTNTDKIKKTLYFNQQGQPIDKKTYYELYPDEK